MSDKDSTYNEGDKKISFLSNQKFLRKFHISYHITWNILLFIMCAFLVFVAFGVGVGAGYFASVVKDEPLRTKEEIGNAMLNYEQTSEIYFANDVYLGRMRTDLECEPVGIENVSQYIIDALISTEDQYYYKHKGIVPKSIFRAIFQEATNASMQTGGSTITQQTAKMSILTSETSFARKFKEILLAQRIETFFSKDKILESYLNLAPFGKNATGRNIAGIQTAAKGIFGIDAKDVNIPQAAFLVGLPNSPSTFTPFKQGGELKEDLTPGLKRMKLVLKRMLNTKAITKEEYNAALSYDIVSNFLPPTPPKESEYPYIMTEVEKRTISILKPLIASEHGYSANDLKENKELNLQYENIARSALKENGYKIHLTIDKDIYDSMQNVVKNFKLFQADHIVQKKNPETGIKERTTEPVEAGAILIDNASGKIISFVGGRDFHREQINHATATLRSNGSTMKPLLVYAPAMEYGVSSPGKPLINVPISIPMSGAKPYQPKNYGNSGYEGITSTRKAVKQSYNVPAILQYKEIIERRPADFLVKMGITSLESQDFTNLSAGIGAITKGVTVEENTNAYTTFANDGKFIDAYLIEKITDASGNIVYEHEVEPVDVFSPQTSFLMREVLRDVINSGTAASLRGLLSFSSDWVGKTGTSQDYHDAILVASNPSVTFGTWMGYDTQDTLQRGGTSYSARNTNLWAQLINSSYKIRPELFKQRDSFTSKQEIGGITYASFDKITGTAPSSNNPDQVGTDLFNELFLPKKSSDSAMQNVVSINGKKYLALEQTPAEFLKKDAIYNTESLAQMGYSYIIDKEKFSELTGVAVGSVQNRKTNIGNFSGSTDAPDKVPSVFFSNQQLTWSKSNSDNVVGYYVYKVDVNSGAAHKIHAVAENETLSFSVPEEQGFTYLVCAVSIHGKISNPSAPE